MSKNLKRMRITFANKGVDVEIPWRLGMNTSRIAIDIYDPKTKKTEAYYFMKSKTGDPEIILERLK